MGRTQCEAIEIDHIDIGLLSDFEGASVGQANNLSRKRGLLPDD
jgi:hypothetical protein